VAINDDTLRLARKMRVDIAKDVNATVRKQVQAWVRAWDELHDEWSTALMDLATTRDDGQWPSPWEIARADRAQQALAHATDKIIDLSEYLGVTVRDALGNVLDTTQVAELAMLQSELPTVDAYRAQVGARWNRLNPDQVDAIVRRTGDTITAATPRLTAAAQDTMRRTLIRGVAVGDNPRKAAADMVRRVEGAFNGGLTRALVIARTEMIDAHRVAAWTARQMNPDMYSGWVWTCALDTRCCPSCWAKHGQVHDISDVGPADHQQGRCTAVPVARPWSELGFDMPEPVSVLPDAQERFWALPQADQVKIMGPARLTALQAGVPWEALTARRLTPGWRPSWTPRPVADLWQFVPTTHPVGV